MALGQNESSRRVAYPRLILHSYLQQLVFDIRKALNTGLALGNDRFRKEDEQLTSQRQHYLKRGPKPKRPTITNKEFLR
jgi:putative transposase